ncbi:hypothetical protein LLG95_05490 [bacterium]|nr:hypothetical protein [bacterium]
MITAHYDAYGYWIESDGLEIYRAGNHPLDSAAYTAEGALSLPTIRAYAQQTAKELAAERSEPYVGIEHMREW